MLSSTSSSQVPAIPTVHQPADLTHRHRDSISSSYSLDLTQFTAVLLPQPQPSNLAGQAELYEDVRLQHVQDFREFTSDSSMWTAWERHEENTPTYLCQMCVNQMCVDLLSLDHHKEDTQATKQCWSDG